MPKKVEVVKSHLNAIMIDGKLGGIIFHDMEKHVRVLYKCEEMDEEEIVSMFNINNN